MKITDEEIIHFVFINKEVSTNQLLMRFKLSLQYLRNRMRSIALSGVLIPKKIGMRSQTYYSMGVIPPKSNSIERQGDLTKTLENKPEKTHHFDYDYSVTTPKILPEESKDFSHEYDSLLKNHMNLSLSSRRTK
jgi:hypothetical protein